jgi:UDP-N-acetyl-D-glucosamine dehydrogenase
MQKKKKIAETKKAQAPLPVIAVVGLGYVGLPLAARAAKKGYTVLGIDIDFGKVSLVSCGISPFADENLNRELRRHPITATIDFSRIAEAEIVVICVPTPVDEHHTPDLRPLASAAQSIAEHLKPGHLVILESTVNPGISDSLVIPILETASGLTCGKDFYLAHCPERINPGDPKWRVENIPRVLGASDPEGLKRARVFYESILNAQVTPMESLKEAEAVKIVENSFRDINIAFVNELAMSFARLGIDIVHVIKGAATKPFAFLPHYPGAGVGGHCIPVDPYYLIKAAEENGFTHRFLALAREINNSMPTFLARETAEELRRRGMEVSGAKVAVLGLAYKPDIDDCRESPSFKIVEGLRDQGMDVAAYDPHVPDLSDASSLDEVLAKKDVVVIATAHSAFVKKITPAYCAKKGVKIVIDGRNCIPKEGFLRSPVSYKGIGR